MIEKYFNGVIEQVYHRIGTAEKNIVMASYNNDFSVSGLENKKRYQEDDNVFFACCELRYETLSGAYAPFLDIICDMFRKFIKGDFEAFLRECGTYELHRSLFLGYYEDGICKREEGVLLNEVEYEQRRMTEAIVAMLKKLTEYRPIMIVINRFQLAGRSSMELIYRLLTEPCTEIGIVLGVNEMQPRLDMAVNMWDAIVEKLEDSSQIYHIGSSGKHRNRENAEDVAEEKNYSHMLAKVETIITFLDCDQAKWYLQKLEYKLKFEDIFVDDITLREFYLLYTRTAILRAELSKALEMVDSAMRLPSVRKDLFYRSECSFLKGTCLMYQGKLQQAEMYAQYAREEAQKSGNEKQIFKAELLSVMARMSGWYNIFFCIQDIPIHEGLIEKLMQNNYRNHLAHIYIYAYDNRPEMVARAYRSEASLLYFSKGVALAKEIGNEQLVYDAYQKNIMLASTNGMNEIAMLYSVRTYQFMKSRDDVYEGRILSGIGYNLSAMGKNRLAEHYYNRAIEVFYHLRLPEDIAEVFYNRALNYIMQENYAKAEHDLLMAMKVIEKLHLNSLRVCNLSKLYGLLALVSIMQKDRFNCERYLLNCRQFLNYIIEKEKENENEEIIHDYAKCDEDMFLYTFSMAMLNRMDGKKEEVLVSFEQAERFLLQAEGNEFFSYRLFRKERMKLFEEMGRSERCQMERATLLQHEEINSQAARLLPMNLLKEIDLGEHPQTCAVREEEIEALIKQEGLLQDYATSRRQMEFISTWQKLIDVNGSNVEGMVQNAFNTFMNHFSLDCALYIYYHEDGAHVLYNDTKCEMTEADIAAIGNTMLEYPQGFAVSKISDSFLEHQDTIGYFGIDDVCSFVAAPFLKNGKLTSLLITYVRMKDNWHGSIERYMLNEDDLRIYSLLFREMEYSINRMEANDKIYMMNRKLQEAAVTDMLTGIYNRAGMYEEIRQMIECYRVSEKTHHVGLMFIDLDNFKHYNDTFGHDVGDLILKEMAKIFRKAVKGRGFVARYGGDEFIMILNTDDREILEQIAKGIYEKINSTQGFQRQIENYLGHAITTTEKSRITCSIGIASAGDVRKEEDINELIRSADEILYKVKTGEKGHYAFL